MPAAGTIYLYRSIKSRGLFCFSTDPKPDGLPEGLSPWRRFGQVRPDENLPHGLAREAINPSLKQHGYQLYRRKTVRSDRS